MAHAFRTPALASQQHRFEKEEASQPRGSPTHSLPQPAWRTGIHRSQFSKRFANAFSAPSLTTPPGKIVVGLVGEARPWRVRNAGRLPSSGEAPAVADPCCPMPGGIARDGGPRSPWRPGNSRSLMLSATRTCLHGWILDRSCPSGTRRIGRDKHDIQMRDLISLPNQGTQDANGSVK